LWSSKRYKTFIVNDFLLEITKVPNVRFKFFEF